MFSIQLLISYELANNRSSSLSRDRRKNNKVVPACKVGHLAMKVFHLCTEVFV